MSYWIEGWVEATRSHGAEQEEEHSWQSVINIGALIDVSDEVSEMLFGLSKRCSSGQFKLDSLAAKRGAPSNPSTEVKANLGSRSECGGYTYATWQEVKSVAIEPHVLQDSDWKTIFDLVRRLEEDYRYSDHKIRFVVWFNW